MKKQIYQFHILLEGSKPRIWRRFQILSTTHFDVLHEVIQTVMGWGDEHLFEYVIDGSTHILDEDMFDDVFGKTIDFREGRICDYMNTIGDKIVYIYDFGDNWHHTITLEKILPCNKTFKHPVCLAGKKACPPEDSGGIGGYYWKLSILKDPNHPDYTFINEWMPDFDPDFFNLGLVNSHLKEIKF